MKIISTSIQSGFTIIEVLMVIMITGILAAVALPQFIDFSKDARTAVTREKLNEIKMAITGDPRAVANGNYLQPGFESHIGSAPSALSELRVQGTHPNYDPFTKRGWRGPYLSTTDPNWNLDGWGTTIQYSQAGRTLRSCGSDLICSNSDDLVVQF